MKVLNYIAHLTGIRPLIMHNGRLANPLDPYAKQLKKLTSKRNKTEEDYENIAAVEFEGALYWSDEIGLYMPSDNLERMVLSAAKGRKLGKQAFAVQVMHEYGVPFQTEGHKSLEALKKNRDLMFQRMVRVEKKRVLRTRPMFPTGWKLDINVELDAEMMDYDQFAEVMDIAGARIGLGDWRPETYGRFGRFVVDSIEKAA